MSKLNVETIENLSATASLNVSDIASKGEFSADTGSSLVGFKANGVGAVASTVQNKLRESVSVKDFGAVGDGVTDDTAAIQAANAASLCLHFPAGGYYNLINWAPLPGTKIIAHGATLQRGATTTYGVTGSSAAIVFANSGVEIFGGKITDDSGLSQSTFSGGVLVDGGDNCALRSVEITGCWGGVFGNGTQNGTNIASGLTIDGCWLHDNQQNTYLADIDGLIVNGSVLENSDRDGLRTYRNVKNITITGNVIRNNGDSTVGQSRDGIDVFIAGNTCTITGNVIYGNKVKGIDIKRNSDGSSELLQNHKFIISGNHIYGNADAGVQCEVVSSVGYVDDLSLFGNHIYDNGNRGVYLTYARGADVSHNNIYNNATDGIRFDNVDGVRVIANHVTNNTGSGINCTSGNNVFVTANTVIGTASQTNGILMSGSLTASVCKDNMSTGHSGVNYQAYGSTLGVKGKVLISPITNTTSSQFIGVSDVGSAAGIEIMLNNTATMDVTVSKRSETTGLNVGNITANAGVSFATAYVAVNQSITGSNSLRKLAGNNAILLTLANITSGFTSGYVKLHYID